MSVGRWGVAVWSRACRRLQLWLAWALGVPRSAAVLAGPTPFLRSRVGENRGYPPQVGSSFCINQPQVCLVAEGGGFWRWIVDWGWVWVGNRGLIWEVFGFSV
jgi:hypothetical protein